jgi:hypothetical protein
MDPARGDRYLPLLLLSPLHALAVHGSFPFTLFAIASFSEELTSLNVSEQGGRSFPFLLLALLHPSAIDGSFWPQIGFSPKLCAQSSKSCSKGSLV